MIGIFSPEFPSKRRVLASEAIFSKFSLYFSTEACIHESADAGAYPRMVSVYTIRTPSPDGQRGAFLPLLPVSLSRVDNCGILPVRQSARISASPKKQKNKFRGIRECRSKQSHLSWRQGSVLRPVATQLVNRPSGVLPSVPVRRLSRTTVSLRGRHLVRGQTCSTASSTPVSVTRPNTNIQAPSFGLRRLGLRGPLACLGLTQKYPSCYRKTSHVQ
ncbi:hypothetical protein SAMN05443635_103196 [Roseobacter denitrificans OCh 114]|nr:hypothetical protein SAMN05443635_103196 [Roseobacter denitrificans OCh 114]